MSSSVSVELPGEQFGILFEHVSHPLVDQPVKFVVSFDRLVEQAVPNRFLLASRFDRRGLTAVRTEPFGRLDSLPAVPTSLGLRGTDFRCIVFVGSPLGLLVEPLVPFPVRRVVVVFSISSVAQPAMCLISCGEYPAFDIRVRAVCRKL